jgi:hypothetical protein
VTGIAPDDDDDGAAATSAHTRDQHMAGRSRDEEWESAVPAKPAAGKNPGNDPARRRMYALLGKAELSAREAKLAYVNDVIGRQVATSNDLTDAEVATVCDRLEAYIKQTEPSEVTA